MKVKIYDHDGVLQREITNATHIELDEDHEERYYVYYKDPETLYSVEVPVNTINYYMEVI